MALCSLAAQAAITNFTAGFESPEGYVAGGALDGQSGWTGYAISTNQTSTNPGTAGNGVIVGGLGGSGQAAYVGLTPLPATHQKFLALAHDTILDPIAMGLPMVNFSARVKLVDSSNGYYDFFSLEFYNQASRRLFSLIFDNFNQYIGYLNSTNGTNGLSILTQGTEYAVNVSMNFASNRCSVALNGVLLANNLPLSATNLALNLGSLDAVWVPHYDIAPGNNYMVFDDIRYVLSPLLPPRPQLNLLTPGGVSNATLRLTGPDGFRFALEGSTNLTAWQGLGTNIVTGGAASYTDPGATNKPARFYRARWVP
jgi:hypothetical protein